MRVLLPALLLCTGCLASQSDAVILPSNTQAGVISMGNTTSGGVGTHLSSELSWASLSPSADTQSDIAIGYQLEDFGESRLPVSTTKDMSGTTYERVPVLFHGPTFVASHRLRGDESWRQWIGAKLEMPMRSVRGTTHVGLGAALRLGAELFHASSGSNHIGAIGVGAYVESGVRKVPGGDPAFLVSSGISLRLPFMATN